MVDEPAEIVKPFAGSRLSPRSLRLLDVILNQTEFTRPLREALHLLPYSRLRLSKAALINKAEPARPAAMERAIEPVRAEHERAVLTPAKGADGKSLISGDHGGRSHSQPE